jgi:hypothetical protein
MKEHDLVRAVTDIDVEGHAVRAGIIGTIVSIYRDGEAFAVEFPELEDVVTLMRAQVEYVPGLTAGEVAELDAGCQRKADQVGAKTFIESVFIRADAENN